MMMIKRVWMNLKYKISDWKESFNYWVEGEITDFVLSHLNLEETILCGAAKATRDKFHITSFLLVIVYYIWKAESKVRSWLSRKSNTEFDNV